MLIGPRYVISNCNPKMLINFCELELIESSCRITLLSNVGIDVPLISGKNFYDQVSTLWLSHKNGPHRFVC